MTSRSYRLSQPRLSWLCSMLLLCSCMQSRVHRSDALNGFIVVGSRWAAQMQSAAGDTLREAAARDVSAAVVDASARFATTDSLGDAKCNRYFAATSRTVVLFSLFCNRNYGNVYGARVFAIFESDGSLVEQFRTVGTDEILAIVPYLRFAR